MEDSVTESEKNMAPYLKVNTSAKVDEEDQVIREANGEKGEKNEDEKEKENGGFSIINNFISTFVSPLTPKSRENVGDGDGDGETKRKREDETQKGVDRGNGGGGAFSSLVSNFFHPSEGGEQEKKEEGNGVVEENKKAKVEEEDGGGGIINNIVSKMPISLPEEATAPPTDEASILIHSIIHD
ncbi:hypothetical protein IFM89_014229 [Coptis chinensis]|uniref:Uncharacterized protein n=1 Tax=Coptis chinensis TaxID=261450 RepID=A0A835H325_9MAGN|nr:hypothetical protein IFM89_014229 [Coptis chinensis]